MAAGENILNTSALEKVVERSAHDSMQALAQAIYDATGLRIRSASFEWLDRSTLAVEGALVVGTKLDTAVGGE